MRMISATRWGPKPDFLLEFYIKYIRSKLEYASLVYEAASPSALRLLDTVQYSAIRVSFGARKTTPKPFLESESGLESLEVRRNVRSLKYLKKLWTSDHNHPFKSTILKRKRLWISSKKQHGIIKALHLAENLGLQVNLNLALEVPNLNITPIWAIQKVPCFCDFEKWDGLDYNQSFTMEKRMTYPEAMDVFTDASKSDKVGAAIWIPMWNVKELYRLHEKMSIFDAEVFAIRQAVSYLYKKLQSGDQVRICTDSKSAVSCLNEFSDGANKSREVSSCFVAMQQLLSKGIKLSLHWIPGHKKIQGNEQADLAAKMAASADIQIMQTTTPTIVFQIEDIIQQIKQFSFEENRNLSGNLLITKKTRRKFENKLYESLSREEGKIAFRLRSQHAATRSYLSRFYGEDPNCIYCGQTETLAHLIIHCVRKECYRTDIRRFMREHRIKLCEELLGGALTEEQSVESINLVCEFLRLIDRKRTL
ncbi:uncharacterized protein LOC136043214 [Artemia franciscana]|uniref:uncharacterized protein LOC136043214 n=1 Tax=Artemia franciscana TaxID=6661 RepID=UPI0032DAAF59